MKQVLTATACAVLLAGCASVYTVTPLDSPEASLTWDRGQATMASDKPLSTVQVRTAGVGEKGRMVFEVAALNKAQAFAHFGYPNLIATDAAGKSLRLFGRADLEREAHNAAGWSRAGVALVATAAVASADSTATTTVEKTIKKPDGSLVQVTEKVYDARTAELLRLAALDRAEVEMAQIERTLDARLAAVHDRNMLEMTTVPPGGAHGGTVLAARPKGGGDAQPVTLQVKLNGEAHSFRFTVEKVR